MDLVEPLPYISATEHSDGANGCRYGSAWVLVRLQTEPIGVVEFPLNDETVSPARLADLIWRALRLAIIERSSVAGSVPLHALPPEGLARDTESPYLLERAAVLAAAPSISVVVCTRDRASQLAGCLAALDRQHYPDYEVVVVDNAPTTDAVARLLATWPATAPVRRLVEPRPGLAWARNRGLRAAAGQVVAYLDDDEVPDRYWLAEIARAFHSDEVGGVSGMILPVALDTPAQVWFEQFGGHSKGRGYTPAVFDSASHALQHPLYPLPAFGAGGNVAFDRGVLAELGGFDVALGTGTPARGAEDTAAICDLMLAGHTLVYQPSAFVRHHHHEDWTGIANQLQGYGTGLTAFYTRMVLRDPRRLLTLLRLAPTAARDLFGRDSVRTARMSTDYPVELTRLQRRGMLAGPGAYLRSRRLQRRLTTLQQTTS